MTGARGSLGRKRPARPGARGSLGRKRPARPGARGSLFYGGVAALGGLVLAESLFLPWYSVDVTVAGAEVGSKPSAWQAMSAMDLLLFLAAMAALGGGVAVMRRKELSLVPFAAGIAGVLLTLVALVDLPEAGVAAVPGDTATVGRRAGGFIALVASAGVAFAGFAAGTLRGEKRRSRVAART